MRIALFAVLAALSGPTFALSADYSVITQVVDFSSVSAALLSILGLGAVFVVVLVGGKWIYESIFGCAAYREWKRNGEHDDFDF